MRNTHLLLGKSGPHSSDIDEVPLNNAHVHEVASLEVCDLLALAFPLPLLLIQTLLTEKQHD